MVLLNVVLQQVCSKLIRAKQNAARAVFVLLMSVRGCNAQCGESCNKIAAARCAQA